MSEYKLKEIKTKYENMKPFGNSEYKETTLTFGEVWFLFKQISDSEAKVEGLETEITRLRRVYERSQFDNQTLRNENRDWLNSFNKVNHLSLSHETKLKASVEKVERLEKERKNIIRTAKLMEGKR